MSETITQYEQYPRSQFPGQVDNWDNMQDINSVNADAAIEYNTLIQNGEYTEAANFLTAHPNLNKILFNADKFNQLMDGIKAVQQFFKDDVETYINGLSNATVGIDDSLKATDLGAKTNAYSAYKIHSLLSCEIVLKNTDVNDLVGDEDGCEKLYCWNEEIAKTLTNLPLGFTAAGILRVIKNESMTIQLLYSNNKIFYRTNLIDSKSWSSVFDYNNILTVTLLTDNWEGSEAPYSQTATVETLKDTDNPLVVSMLQDGASESEQKAYNKAFSFLAAGTNVIADGSITFKVYKKPLIDFEIGLKGV